MNNGTDGTTANGGDHVGWRPHPEFKDFSDSRLDLWQGKLDEEIGWAREGGEASLASYLELEMNLLQAERARRSGGSNSLQLGEAVLIKLSDVQPKKLQWLWHSRIPLGKVTVLDGDPGLGKSLISIDIASCVSTGKPMPNAAAVDLAATAGVVFLSAEDDPEDTIRPRLELAGADLTRVVLLSAVKHPDGLCLPTIEDLNAMREAVKVVDAKLVVIDPLMAYLPAETNSYRDQDMRRSLRPLASLASELAVAILVIRHLNKTSSNNPLYRGGGSIGIIGAARSGLLVTKDPDDEARCVFSVAKSNLAKFPPSLAYSIIANPAEVPFVNWHGPTQHTAASLLADQAENAEDRSALKEAEDFLEEYLEKEPCKATEVLKESRKACIAEKTLRRAKARLKVWSKPKEYQGERYWGLNSQSWPESMSPEMAKEASDGHIKYMAETGEDGRD